MMLVSRALAVVRGRDFVVPEDVKAVAVAVLGHRITVKPELWMTAASAKSVVHDVLGQVPAPAAREMTMWYHAARGCSASRNRAANSRSRRRVMMCIEVARTQIGCGD